MCGVTAEPAVAERPAAPAIAPARRPRRRPGALRVLYAGFFPAPGLPALGPAFNPVTGGWTMAADAQVTDRSFRLAGLEQPVRVLFESDGTGHITARIDHDLFLATGYVHARFRLFQ